MDLGIKDKRVVITGASRGLGKELAIKFAEEGAKLTLIARNKDNLEKIINSNQIKKNNHNFTVADLKEKNEPTKVAKEIILKNKKIDIVIHNLGGSLGSTDIFSDFENW